MKKARILIHNGGEDSFDYKIVEFKTLNYLDSLKGDFGCYYSGTVMEQKGFESTAILGQEAKLSYVVEEDVIIPTSFHSNVLLTHYYYLETLLEYWKARGLDFYDVKYRVYYEPKIASEYNGEEVLIKVKGNAAFIFSEERGYKSFAVFAEDKEAGLPIAMNFSVWAHEFGHNIFDKAFARRDQRAYLSNLTRPSHVLSGMNEGVADFYSAVVTESRLEGLHISISEGVEKRVLPVSFTSSSLKEDSNFYEWGSVLASSLYELGLEYGQQEVALQLYHALEELRYDWDFKGNAFDYHHLVKRILDQISEKNIKNNYAQIFLRWFDDLNNQRNIISYIR